MKVLFICIGNVNRSRSAEAILKAKNMSDLEVSSRGLLPSTVGRPISDEMYELLTDEEKNHVSLGAKLLTNEDLKDADIIYVMDEKIFTFITTKYDRICFSGKIQFLSGRYDEPILDPYDTHDFKTCYDQLKKYIDKNFKK